MLFESFLYLIKAICVIIILFYTLSIVYLKFNSYFLSEENANEENKFKLNAQLISELSNENEIQHKLSKIMEVLSKLEKKIDTCSTVQNDQGNKEEKKVSFESIKKKDPPMLQDLNPNNIPPIDLSKTNNPNIKPATINKDNNPNIKPMTIIKDSVGEEYEYIQ